MHTKIAVFEVFFGTKSIFLWQKSQLLPFHTIHILKDIVPAVNLVYLGTLYVHPVIRPIFCNILGLNWQYKLKPCLNVFKSKQRKEKLVYVILKL